MTKLGGGLTPAVVDANHPPQADGTQENANVQQRIVSISRRTDVPAFYGDWFVRRLNAGFAGWENPFGRQRYLVSLRREDVLCLAFWSKNYRPFLPHLRTLKAQEWPCFFNYTITGLPAVFECNLVPAEDAVDSLKALSALFSPDAVTWRYDPVTISERTPAEVHLGRFSELAAALEGHVSRCAFSFPVRYGKVERNFAAFEREQGFRILDPGIAERRDLAGKLAEIGARHGIGLYTCCGDYLIGGRIGKAHCLDGEAISRIHYGGRWQSVERPTRKECGCAESVDIGAYDTCPHGCIYCYANIHKQQAMNRHRTHDPDAAFLGYARAQADAFVEEIRANKVARVNQLAFPPSTGHSTPSTGNTKTIYPLAGGEQRIVP